MPEYTPQLLTSIKAACQTLNVGRTYLYTLIKRGHLDTVKLGRRTLVKVSSIKALIGESEVAQ
jgi:excisionase family DNA binding protein